MTALVSVLTTTAESCGSTGSSRGPNLSGGMKSNRLIAEAMARRGHDVNLCYTDLPKPWPRPWQVRLMWQRLWQDLSLIGRAKHHLEHTTANRVPVKHDPIRPQDVPDAHVCIASWWQVRQSIEPWPDSKGIRVHLIRDYEAKFAGMAQRVEDTYRLPGVQVVISGWLKRILQEKFGREPVVIPNGVDWRQFQASPRGKSAVPTVGMLYGQSERKRADIGFEAMRIVQKTLPKTRLISFGRNPVSSRHPPPQNFTFHLRPAQSLIPQLYQQCDVWLTPSRQEGFGMPGLEAAACYCPIVSTRCGGTGGLRRRRRQRLPRAGRRRGGDGRGDPQDPPTRRPGVACDECCQPRPGP